MKRWLLKMNRLMASFGHLKVTCTYTLTHPKSVSKNPLLTTQMLKLGHFPTRDNWCIFRLKMLMLHTNMRFALVHTGASAGMGSHTGATNIRLLNSVFISIAQSSIS